MRRQILFKVAGKYYLICMDVDKYVEAEDILEFLECRDITDKASLFKALDEYVKRKKKPEYVPHWFVDKLDAICELN